MLEFTYIQQDIWGYYSIFGNNSVKINSGNHFGKSRVDEYVWKSIQMEIGGLFKLTTNKKKFICLLV